MATLFKKISTRPLPAGAKVLRRGDEWFAEWMSGDKKRRARIKDEHATRYQQASRTWYCRYRDARGLVAECNTKCTDKELAARAAARLQAHTEKILSGLLTESEAESLAWANVPLSRHMADFKAHMDARGLHKDTIGTRCYHLRNIFEGCGFRKFADVKASRIEAWLRDAVNLQGMGHRTHNAHIAACIAFGNWAIKQKRLMVNPFVGMERRSEKLDARRVRRAFTPMEAARLIDAALHRPVKERQTNRGGNAKLSPATRDALQWLGITRAMAYRVLFGSGLRYKELKSVTIGQCSLDSDPPYITLAAADEKNRQGAEIVLQSDLAQDLATYIGERIRRLTDGSRTVPINEVMDAPLFQLPKQLKPVLDADLPRPGPVIKANEGQIQQVLANLIYNASEAYCGGKGPVWLAVKNVSPAEIPTGQRSKASGS